jgi:hypothetical protein
MFFGVGIALSVGKYLSQDANLRIPENEIDILNMVKKYLQEENEDLKGQEMESKMSN